MNTAAKMTATTAATAMMTMLFPLDEVVLDATPAGTVGICNIEDACGAGGICDDGGIWDICVTGAGVGMY